MRRPSHVTCMYATKKAKGPDGKPLKGNESWRSSKLLEYFSCVLTKTPITDVTRAGRHLPNVRRSGYVVRRSH